MDKILEQNGKAIDAALRQRFANQVTSWQIINEYSIGQTKIVLFVVTTRSYRFIYSIETGELLDEEPIRSTPKSPTSDELGRAHARHITQFLSDAQFFQLVLQLPHMMTAEFRHRPWYDTVKELFIEYPGQGQIIASPAIADELFVIASERLTALRRGIKEALRER
jgi:hypothetical protein